MHSLYVHADLGDGDIVLVGQLKIDFDGRRSGFKYARSYCRHPQAFSLDPINLPLDPLAIYETPVTRDQLGIPGALLDAGPDHWGRRVLIALFDPPPSTDLDFLLAGSGMGVGCLYFTTHKNDIPNPPPPSEFSSIDDVLETALMIDQGLEVDREKAMFFHHGSSLGGARPKTFIDEREEDPVTGEMRLRRWIVKFPRHGELVDVCRLEHASMELARHAGIDVPETRIIDTSMGHVYLVERFDIDQSAQQAHMVSFRSLINGHIRPEDANSDSHSYANIARLADQLGSDRNEAAAEVYRRLLLNVSIGNRDDHTLNHAFIKPPGSNKYRLSPAYDILPTVGHEMAPQSIAVCLKGGRASKDTLLDSVEELGLTDDQALAVANDVLEAVESWEDYFRSVGLNEKEMSIVGRSFTGIKHVQQMVGVLTQRQQRDLKHSSHKFSL